MNSKGIPILMYHAITENSDEPDGSYIHVNRRAFEQQMQWLYEHSYKAVSIKELLEALQRKTFQKMCVITFDDGYRSLLEYAAPVLKKYHFKATLFLTTAAVGEKNYTSFEKHGICSPKEDRPLTWDELQWMQNNGWEVQAHGAEHLKHNMLSEELLYEEMNNSKAAIARHLNGDPLYYSFPFGSYNTRCLRMLFRLNMVAGFSVHQGLASSGSDIRRLPRIEIHKFDNLKTFERKVLSGFASKHQMLKSKLLYLIYGNTYIKDFFKSMVDKLKGS